MPSSSAIPGVTIRGKLNPQQADVLRPEVQAFIATLHRTFNPRRLFLLRRREERQKDIDNGKFPDFLPETEQIRLNDTWRAAKPAPGLTDRRVEITGPVDRKMVINALNAGATQFMSDFEDSTSPTWDNIMSGHVNMRDATARTIAFTGDNKKEYKLRADGKIATLLVRPRGWHLEEKHFLVDGAPCSASIFDFAIHFFNNAKKAIEMGWGPYFYLPKMESHLEARLWNDIFNTAQDYIALPRGSIRATCLIETILGAYEMDEIIYELREHSSGLNCGRWDYIFSVIKRFRNHPKFILPDRADITMTTPFMDAYVRLLIKTCHRRGVHAMGGMAAQIPIKNDPAANDRAIAKVRADKLREVQAGHDGTWVAHPALVPIAMDIFNKHMPQPNQMHIRREDTHVTAFDLMNTNVKGGKITEAGVRANASIGLAYMAAWLDGQGCVPIHNLMEDAATAEISRSQLWQWVRHAAKTDKGTTITAEYVADAIEKEVALVKKQLGAKYDQTKYDLAKKLFLHMSKGEAYPDFITSACYDSILTIDPSAKL